MFAASPKTLLSLSKAIGAMAFEAGRIFGRAQAETESLEKLFNSVQE